MLATIMLPQTACCRSPWRASPVEAYREGAGHYLGLDTHDCAGNSSCLLQAGMVITIEPGLYIPDDPAYGDYAGIGIRLEDDVAITAAEPEVRLVSTHAFHMTYFQPPKSLRVCHSQSTQRRF